MDKNDRDLAWRDFQLEGSSGKSLRTVLYQEKTEPGVIVDYTVPRCQKHPDLPTKTGPQV